MATKKTTTRTPKVEQDIDSMKQWQIEHGKEDARNFVDIRRELTTTVKKADLEIVKQLLLNEKGELKLATKEDVAEVLEVFKNINNAASLMRKSGSLIWKVLFGLVTLVAMWNVLKGGLQDAFTFMRTMIIGL